MNQGTQRFDGGATSDRSRGQGRPYTAPTRATERAGQLRQLVRIPRPFQEASGFDLAATASPRRCS